MNEDNHRKLRVMIGLHVIDRLEGADCIAMEDHLAGCAACRAEVAQLRGIVTMLDLVDANAIDRKPCAPSATETHLRWAQRRGVGRGCPFRER